VASRLVTRSIGHAATRVPGIRRVPVLKLISIAEVGMLARQHLLRLTPAERRRLVGLLRVARGRPRNLSQAQRQELAELVAKLEPRLLAGEAVNRLSPVPLPKRIRRGSAKTG
jgi:hypothetical protein